jgi:CYTH domain-containing protein
MEIERKFTVKTLPENLAQYECKQIEQAYLNTDPVVRIRKEDNQYYLTYKGRGLMVREEYNLPLNEQSYYHLRDKADGNIISKKRYVVPLSGVDSNGQRSADVPTLFAEIDLFDPPHAPLIIVEVEFPDQETANDFIPPDWFGEDVTMKREYHNSFLSKKVFAPTPQIGQV